MWKYCEKFKILWIFNKNSNKIEYICLTLEWYVLFIFYFIYSYFIFPYVVIEVEKLKQNREKRSIRPAEIKEEKVAFMNKNLGNPNWETAQMIREYQAGIVSSKMAWPLISPTVKWKRAKHIRWAGSLMANRLIKLFLLSLGKCNRCNFTCRTLQKLSNWFLSFDSRHLNLKKNFWFLRKV